jgi:hypothetical protein
VSLRGVAACAIAEIVVVAVTAATQPTSGALAVLAALVLAPVAVVAVARAAARFAGGRFPLAAAIVYVLLPFIGNRFVLGQYRAAYDRNALPALVGLQHTGLFALGVLAVAAAALAPERVAAAAGAVVLVVALVVWHPSGLGDVQPFLHETAYSVALPEWVLAASIVALVLRRPYLGAAVGCLAIAAVLRAAQQPLDDQGFWRELGVLAPLGAVLLSGLWLLVPRLRPARARTAAS